MNVPFGVNFLNTPCVGEGKSVVFYITEEELEVEVEVEIGSLTLYFIRFQITKKNPS